MINCLVISTSLDDHSKRKLQERTEKEMLLSVFFPILPGAVFDDCVMMRKNGAKLTGGGGGRTLSEVQLSQEINYSMEDLVHIQSNQ